jgi:hypothetical protein
MGKTRIGVVLRESVGGAKSSNQSADLVALADRYNVFVKKLHILIHSLQQHHAVMIQIDKTRTQVRTNNTVLIRYITRFALLYCGELSSLLERVLGRISAFCYYCFAKSLFACCSRTFARFVSVFPLQTAKSLADLSKGTPLWDATGLMPSADRPSNTVNSYASVHDTLSAKAKSYATKFKQFVLDYAMEWDKVVRTRVEGGLKKADLLRRELDHYQKKVEALRLSTNQAMAKGKTVAPATAERLGRNEEKLVSSKQGYNKIATDLCILMEEVTERAWRDLHPLLIKCAQFDMTMSGDESSILSGLSQSVSDLKLVATENGLSPQARLKDIATLSPELLSTRPGGVSGLMITSGGEPLAGSRGSSMAQPPGSVGPQGLGGYPVQVSSATEPPGPYEFSRNTSFNSYASAPAPSSQGVEPLSTMSMLSISQASAPAPTYEDMYAANQSTAMSVHSAPYSGNYPPMSPASRQGSFDPSVYSDHSGYDGAPVAAAPAAPPPPPPRSAPLPPSYGAPIQNYGPPSPQNYGAPPPQNYGAPQSYGAPSNSYSSPSNYGSPPPMADARSMGPAPGRYAPDPPSTSGQQPYYPPRSMNPRPFDEPANSNPFGN